MDVAAAAALIGQTIDFSVYGSALGTQNFKNAVVNGVLNAASASRVSNIYQDHAAIFPALPVGSVNNAGGYQYITVTLPNREVRAFGLPWIVQDTVRVHGAQVLTLTLHKATEADAARLRSYLVSNNLTEFQIQMN